VLVFAIFGPPIGGLVFFLLEGFVELSFSSLGWMIFAALVFVPFTYQVGLFSAVAAGCLIALAYAQFSRVGLVTALAVGVLVGIGFIAVNGNDSVPLPVAPGGRTMPAHSWVILSANVIPTLLLWWGTRSWFGPAAQSERTA
jgi:hypothetical protein